MGNCLFVRNEAVYDSVFGTTAGTAGCKNGESVVWWVMLGAVTLTVA